MTATNDEATKNPTLTSEPQAAPGDSIKAAMGIANAAIEAGAAIAHNMAARVAQAATGECTMNPLHDGPCDGGPYAAGGDASTWTWRTDVDLNPASADTTARNWFGDWCAACAEPHVFGSPQCARQRHDQPTERQPVEPCSTCITPSACTGLRACLSIPARRPLPANAPTAVAVESESQEAAEAGMAAINDAIRHGAELINTPEARKVWEANRAAFGIDTPEHQPAQPQPLLDIEPGALVTIVSPHRTFTARVKHVDKLAGTVTLDERPDDEIDYATRAYTLTTAMVDAIHDHTTTTDDDQ